MYSKRRLMTILAIFYLLAPDQCIARGRGRRSHEKSAHGHHLKSPEGSKLHGRHAASLMSDSTEAPSEVAPSTKTPEVITEITTDATTTTTTTTTTATTATTSTVATPETPAASITTSKEIPMTTQQDPNTVVVEIETGKVRGQFIDVSTDYSVTKQISRFRGIKFAEPPLGEKRYKPPEAAQPWTGVKDALKYQKNCFQWRDNSFDGYFPHKEQPFEGTEMWNSNTGVSEDCLYVNVWTPVTDFTRADRGLNVMVWIYGGGFYSGSSSLDVYDGQWLAATEDVVVVSMNYRVAALGFLVYDDENIKGNAGLYDQRMALEWVQNNIRHFGGDPKSVTLFGESAGAASVSMHLVSPKSRHLFKNAIVQSGSLLSPWSILPVAEAKRRSELLAEKLNCSTRYPETNKTITDANERKRASAIKCFQNVDAKELVDTEIAYLSLGTFRFPNAVVISDDFVSEDPKEKPPKIPDDANVMVGYNSNEGSYFLIYGSPGWEYNTTSTIDEKEFNQGLEMAIKNPIGDNAAVHVRDQMVKYSDFVYTQGKKPATMDYKSKCSSPTDQPCVEQLSHMSGKPTNGTFYRDRLDDMVGDVAVVCPLLQLAEHLNIPTRSPGKLFFYHFDERSTQNPWPEWMGVMHGYEIEFVFGLPLDKTRNYTREEQKLSRDMMRMWANFAKHGDPNSVDEENQWKEYDMKDRCINRIALTKNGTSSSLSSFLTPQYSSLMRHCSFWNEYFPQLFKIAKTAEPTTTPPTTMESTNTGAKMSPLHAAAGRSYPMTLLILLSYHLFAMLMMCL